MANQMSPLTATLGVTLLTFAFASEESNVSLLSITLPDWWSVLLFPIFALMAVAPFMLYKFVPLLENVKRVAFGLVTVKCLFMTTLCLTVSITDYFVDTDDKENDAKLGLLLSIFVVSMLIECLLVPAASEIGVFGWNVIKNEKNLRIAFGIMLVDTLAATLCSAEVYQVLRGNSIIESDALVIACIGGSFVVMHVIALVYSSSIIARLIKDDTLAGTYNTNSEHRLAASYRVKYGGVLSGTLQLGIILFWALAISQKDVAPVENWTVFFILLAEIALTSNNILVFRPVAVECDLKSKTRKPSVGQESNSVIEDLEAL